MLCPCPVGQYPIQPHTLLPLKPVPFPFTVSVGYHQAQRGVVAPELPDGVLPPQVFERVPVQPRDAREASDVFYKQNIGDVLLNYENEVVLTNEMYGADALPYIVPDNNVNVRRCSRVVTHAEHARHHFPQGNAPEHEEHGHRLSLTWHAAIPTHQCMGVHSFAAGLQCPTVCCPANKAQRAQAPAHLGRLRQELSLVVLVNLDRSEPCNSLWNPRVPGFSLKESVRQTRLRQPRSLPCPGQLRQV